MPDSRRHAYSPPAGDRPAVPEPSYDERARTLVHLASVGALSTHSVKQPGFPFGSVMPYALDDRGRPIFLVSSMAMHTQNLNADPRASLLITQQGAENDPLGAGRVTLIGETRNAPPEETRERYLARHENARYWVDFEDFAFYRMEVADVYFVGGFGVMGWVAADGYSAASADPLAESARRIIEHMNADHEPALITLTQTHAGLEASSAQMTAVDRLGFHVRAKTSEGMKGARIGFPEEVRSAADARRVLVEMVRRAESP
jgi:heme iron utilization protein